MNDQPNVVFITTDQQPAHTLGAVDPSYSTPNLDALAADAVRFDHCYCTYPQCSPSRSTLLTGQYPHQTGVYTLSNWGPYELDPSAPSVARAFRDAGYETVWGGGRWDLGVENITDLGYRRTRNVDVTGSTHPEGLRRDEVTVEESVDFVHHHADEAPFFLTASFNLPHPPYVTDESFADRYSKDEIPVPESFGDDLHGKPTPHRELADRRDMTKEDARELGYQYRTMVSRIDSFVGQLLDALRDSGVLEDTAVVFTSDHGNLVGEHGMHGKHTLAYDELLRVPLLVRKPGGEDGGEVVEQLVSSRAIPGTLLEAANLAVPDAFEGGSVYSSGSRDSHVDGQVFFEHKYATGRHHPYRGVRTRTWKYVEYLTGEGAELYDLDTDPDEMTNLAGRPENAAVERRLQTAVQEWWNDTDGDCYEWINSPTPG